MVFHNIPITYMQLKLHIVQVGILRKFIHLIVYLTVWPSVAQQLGPLLCDEPMSSCPRCANCRKRSWARRDHNGAPVYPAVVWVVGMWLEDGSACAKIGC